MARFLATPSRRATPAVHRPYNGKVLAGFAGGTADAFTLLERFALNRRPIRATWSAPPWRWPRTGRTDRPAPPRGAAGRRRRESFIITGNGDVVQLEHDPSPSAAAATLPSPPPSPCWRTPSSTPRASSRSPSRLRATSASSPTTPSKCWITHNYRAPNKAPAKPHFGMGPARPGQERHHVRDDPERNRPRAGQTHHWSGRRQARGRRRPAYRWRRMQLSEEMRHEVTPEEHPDDRA